MSKKKTKDEVIITIDYDDKFKDYQEVLDKFKAVVEDKKIIIKIS